MPMRPNLIQFPGFRGFFDKNLLKNIVNYIQNNISDVQIFWLKCKPPFTIASKPSEYHPCNFNDANMVIIKSNGLKIFESYQYRSGSGAILIYEQNLNKNKFDLIAKILQDNRFQGLITSEEREKYKPAAIIAITSMIMIIIFLIIIEVNQEFLFSLPFWPYAFITVSPIIILLIVFCYSFIKLMKIRRH